MQWVTTALCDHAVRHVWSVCLYCTCSFLHGVNHITNFIWDSYGNPLSPLFGGILHDHTMLWRVSERVCVLRMTTPRHAVLVCKQARLKPGGAWMHAYALSCIHHMACAPMSPHMLSLLSSARPVMLLCPHTHTHTHTHEHAHAG